VKAFDTLSHDAKKQTSHVTDIIITPHVCSSTNRQALPN